MVVYRWGWNREAFKGNPCVDWLVLFCWPHTHRLFWYKLQCQIFVIMFTNNYRGHIFDDTTTETDGKRKTKTIHLHKHTQVKILDEVYLTIEIMAARYTTILALSVRPEITIIRWC